jgi:hypothetical protein
MLNCPFLTNNEIIVAKKYYKNSLKFKVLDRIKQMSDSIILREDIQEMGEPRQISRCLKDLVEMGKLTKIGYGIYAKSYISENINKPIIEVGFYQACKEALTKLNVKWEPGSAEKAYNAGKSMLFF